MFRLWPFTCRILLEFDAADSLEWPWWFPQADAWWEEAGAGIRVGVLGFALVISGLRYTD